MKQITESIKNILNDETLLSEIKKQSDINPTAIHGDVTLKDASERFDFLRDSILSAINNGSFDDISHNRRNAMLNVLNALNQHKGNPQQIIAQIEGLHDHSTISGLFYREIGKKNYEQELKDLTSLKRKYSNFLKQFDGTKKNLEFIQNKRTELEQLLKNSEDIKNKITDLKTSSEGTATKVGESLVTANQQIENLKKSEEEINNKIKEVQEDIEKKRLQITAFHENIEEYKKSIQILETKAKEIIAKEVIINGLIDSAEKALQLKSAEGISAAFSAQYDSASKKWVSRGWLIGAGAFVVIAILFTIWIVTGWGIPTNSEIRSLIGRVVAVAIAITGATFCAKQYIRQKNLADDYGYKAVLSKSIVAFTEEIKKRDEKQVPTYLIKVLDEIHKDPLRARERKGESGDGITEKSISLLEKLSEIIKPKG